MQKILYTSIAIVTLAFPFVISAPVYAEDNVFTQSAAISSDNYTAENPIAEESKWDVTAGAGVVLRPTYEGSENYTVMPVPFVNAVYNDMFSIGPDGANVYWRNKQAMLGASLTYSSGREDEDGSIFTNGDDDLRGMGDIDPAIGVRGFTSYDFGIVAIKGSVTQFTGDDNDGLLADLVISAPYYMTDQLSITPHIGATWADEDYMQTFFGVTSRQSANSGFSQYSADSGIKDISIGVKTNYMLSENWFFGLNSDVKNLTGDAADSPISQSNTQVTIMSLVGYNF